MKYNILTIFQQYTSLFGQKVINLRSLLVVCVYEMARCVINIKELALKGGENSFRLDDAFFQDFNNEDITGGDVEVSIDVKKSQDAKYDYIANYKVEGVLHVPCTRCLEDMDYETCLADCVKVICCNEMQEYDDEDLLTARADGTLDLSPRIFETLALNVPSVHVHPEGECNPAITKWLEDHSSEIKEQTDEI